MSRGACLPTIVVAALVGSAGALPAQEPKRAPDPVQVVAETLELPAGGLVLVPDERLAVENEEVLLGSAAVRVSYGIRNRGDDRLRRVVAWALPEIDMNAIGEEKVALPGGDMTNFAGATAKVDGAAVTLAFEQRAWAFSRDLTVVLVAAGVPLNPMTPGIASVLRALPPAQLAEIEERGAIIRDDDRILPNWTVRTTAFWRQTFEPGKLVTIGLAYAPITASGTWRPEALDEWRQTYCIDADVEAAVAARQAKSGARDGLAVRRLTYTIANEPGWWAAVPRFRLGVEKTRLETLVATCWKGLRPAGPTLLDSSRSDFKPTEDIRVMLIE